MVSYPESVDHAAAPPSSASRLSVSHSSRRPHHRHGHSHHGGASYQPHNDFPIFSQTGDVEIIISSNGQERRYLLHRLILAQCSSFFEASTSDALSPLGPTRDDGPSESNPSLPSFPEDGASSVVSGRTSLQNGAPPRKRWRFELDWDNRDGDEPPILVQRPPEYGRDFAQPATHSTKPPAPPPRSSFLRTMANMAGMQSAVHLPSTARNREIPDAELDPLIRDYDNLFRIFYNYPPILNSVNVAVAYSECKSLLNLANMYDALPVVGPRIDHHLLRFSSRLFKQIAKYPPSYLKLGYLARSRVIFSEALIHVVGQWPAGLQQLRNSPLPDSVLDLIEDKVEDLEELKARVDAKLFRLTLTTSRGERVNPSNAYLDWLAVSLFRHWFVENSTPPPASILKNGSSRDASREAPPQAPAASGRVYRLIGSSSPDAYLSHDELKRFLKQRATASSDALYTRENLKRFERKMDEIKRLAREIVKPLLRNFLELDLKETDGVVGLPYLTCTKVEEKDFPWD